MYTEYGIARYLFFSEYVSGSISSFTNDDVTCVVRYVEIWLIADEDK